MTRARRGAKIISPVARISLPPPSPHPTPMKDVYFSSDVGSCSQLKRYANMLRIITLHTHMYTRDVDELDAQIVSINVVLHSLYFIGMCWPSNLYL